jgi:hypothetical protein
MFLSDVSIRRPVFATMMMVTLVVLGVVAYGRLAVDEYPDVTYPTVVAQTSYPGASPEVMEREVSRPIEEALNTVQGIQEITSTSLEGSSLVRVQLQLGVDVMAAQQEVQSKIARIRRQLPEDIEDPVIIRFDPNERPIMSIAVQSSARPMRELTDLADEVISTRLEAIPGVGGVNLVGGAARQIRVQLDPNAMRSYGVSPPQVVQALQRENQEVPAGRVRRGDQERLVRITGADRGPARLPRRGRGGSRRRSRAPGRRGDGGGRHRRGAQRVVPERRAGALGGDPQDQRLQHGGRGEGGARGRWGGRSWWGRGAQAGALGGGSSRSATAHNTVDVWRGGCARGGWGAALQEQAQSPLRAPRCS